MISGTCRRLQIFASFVNISAACFIFLSGFYSTASLLQAGNIDGHEARFSEGQLFPAQRPQLLPGITLYKTLLQVGFHLLKKSKRHGKTHYIVPETFYSSLHGHYCLFTSTTQAKDKASRKPDRRIYKSTVISASCPYVGIDRELVEFNLCYRIKKPGGKEESRESYININGTFYYLCGILDGCSRYIVHWELRESMMTEADIEIILQRAREKHPNAIPRFISDNGPQFVAKDIKKFIRVAGMTYVRTAP